MLLGHLREIIQAAAGHQGLRLGMGFLVAVGISGSSAGSAVGSLSVPEVKHLQGGWKSEPQRHWQEQTVARALGRNR